MTKKELTTIKLNLCLKYGVLLEMVVDLKQYRFKRLLLPTIAKEIFQRRKTIRKMFYEMLIRKIGGKKEFNWKIPRKYYQYLRNGLRDKKRVGDIKQDEIIKRIITAYKITKIAQQSMPIEYQTGGEWENILDIYYRKLTNALVNEDLELLKEIYSNIFRSEASRGLGMVDIYWQFKNQKISNKLLSDFVNLLQFKKPGSIKKNTKLFIYNFCHRLSIWKEYLSNKYKLNDLSFPLIGNPFGMEINGILIPFDTIRHHYYATRILELLKKRDKFIICEIGGGFGGIAYHLIKKSEGKNIKYIDFDLPEMITIISYFLMSAYPNKRFLLFGEDNLSNSVFDSYDIILMPNFELSKLSDRSIDFFFNSMSLTEMDKETVEEYLKQINRCCNKYFMHENHDDTNVYDYKKMKRHIQMSKYDLHPESFKKIYRFPDLWEADHYEYLYERIDD